MSRVSYADGGDLLAQFLRRNGVEVAFGVISVHNIPLVEAVASRLRFVPVRHEAAAVNAADGYARASGGLGCAITSTGTGAGNASGSMIEALTAGTPLLHVTSNIPTEFLDAGGGFIHEFPAQPKMLEAVSSWSARISDCDLAPVVLAGAIGRALGEAPGPVSVEWPIDLQYASGSYEVDDSLGYTRNADSAVELDVEATEQAAKLLASSRRPVLWLGGGARRAVPQVLAFAEMIGAAVLSSNSGRGVLPEDHELCIGNYGTSSAGRRILEEADLIVSIGTHFRSNETATYKMPLPALHIQIDIQSDAIGRTYPVTVGIVGDASRCLDALISAVDTSNRDESWRARVLAARRQARTEQRSAIGPHGAICDAIRSALPRESVIARDVTIASSSWGNRLLEIYDPRSNIFARGGGIGQGLAMGIGASLARPDVPTLVIVGDGGLAVHLGELLTAVQEHPNLTVVVFNDGGYGVLRNAQLARGQSPCGVDLQTPDFNLLAQSLPMPYWQVRDETDAAGIIAEAVDSPGPAMVEIDLTSIGPMKVAFTPPVEVPAEASRRSDELL